MSLIIEILILAMAFLILLAVGAIFFLVRKGFNQVIEGLESIDENLANLYKNR